MDPIYGPQFESQVSGLVSQSLDRLVYAAVAAIIDSMDQNTTPPNMLRSDARLFLILNMGAMIVIPWEKANGLDFFKQYKSQLEDDVKDIITEAKQLAIQQSLKEISANLIVFVIGTRRGGTRTRGINIWGP